MLGVGYKAAVASFLILLNSLTTICQTSVPRNWQKINAEGLFTFCLPPGMKKTGMTGVESFLGEYLGGERRFLFIYEPYSFLSYGSRRSDEMKDYQETETKIGGRKAVIRTYHTAAENAYYLDEKGQTTYVAELLVGNWAKSEVELFMSLESKSSSDVETAQRV